jgi:hypothetical protein
LEGWEPLCEFLGADVPDAPFPKVNSREELQARMAGPMDENAAREHVRAMQKKH